MFGESNSDVCLDRDFNAALNLEHYFTDQYNTVGTTEINACGDNTSTLRAIVMQVLSSNQEAPSFMWV